MCQHVPKSKIIVNPLTASLREQNRVDGSEIACVLQFIAALVDVFRDAELHHCLEGAVFCIDADDIEDVVAAQLLVLGLGSRQVFLQGIAYPVVDVLGRRSRGPFGLTGP